MSSFKVFAGAAAGLAAILTFVGLGQPAQAAPDQTSPKRKDKVVLTDAEWKKKLTKKQYEVLRAKGTEPAFCGLLLDNHDKGTYLCVGCDLPLFTSEAKFTSGTGWPSFFQPATPDAIWIKTDRSHGMVRDEVLCARCDGHLGHVFNDGPTPTGLRFCMNSEVLKFVKAKPPVKSGGAE
jgi:methionine-R-sulfoxide reductase